MSSLIFFSGRVGGSPDRCSTAKTLAPIAPSPSSHSLARPRTTEIAIFNAILYARPPLRHPCDRPSHDSRVRSREPQPKKNIAKNSLRQTHLRPPPPFAPLSLARAPDPPPSDASRDGGVRPSRGRASGRRGAPGARGGGGGRNDHGVGRLLLLLLHRRPPLARRPQRGLVAQERQRLPLLLRPPPAQLPDQRPAGGQGHRRPPLPLQRARRQVGHRGHVGLREGV